MTRNPDHAILGTFAAEAAKAAAIALQAPPDPGAEAPRVTKRLITEVFEPLRPPTHGRLTREELFAHRDRKYDSLVFEVPARQEPSSHPLFAPNLADRQPIMKADAPEEHWSRFVMDTPTDELADLINATSPPFFGPNKAFTWAQRLAILFFAYGPVRRTASVTLPCQVLKHMRCDWHRRPAPARDIKVSTTIGEGPPTFQINRLQPGCGKTACSLASAAALMQGEALAHIWQARAAAAAGRVVPSTDAMRPVTIIAAAETTFLHFKQTAELMLPILSEWYGVPFAVTTSVGGAHLKDMLQPTFWIIPTVQLNRVLRDNAAYGFVQLICDEFTSNGTAGQTFPWQRASAFSMTILNATPDQLETCIHRHGGLLNEYTGNKDFNTGRHLQGAAQGSNTRDCILAARGMCLSHLFQTPASLVTLVRDSLAHMLPSDLGFLEVRCRYSTLSARMSELDVDIVPISFGTTIMNALSGFRCSSSSKLVLAKALGMEVSFGPNSAKRARTEPTGSVHIDLTEIARVVRTLEPMKYRANGTEMSEEDAGVATRDRVADRLDTYAKESCPICCASTDAPAVLSCCGFMACAGCVRRHCVRSSASCPNCRAHLPASVYDERAFVRANPPPAAPVAPREEPTDEFLAALQQEDALIALIGPTQDQTQHDCVRQVLRGFRRLGLQKVLIAVNGGMNRGNAVLDEFGDCGFNVIRGDPFLNSGRNLVWDERIDSFLSADQPTAFLLYAKLKQALAGTDRLSGLDAVVLVGRQDASTMEQTIGRIFRPSFRPVEDRKRCLVVSVRAAEMP